MYRPRNALERKYFPNLGRAKIVSGPVCVGQVGIIIQRDNQVARIVFDHFWDRPDGERADWNKEKGPDNIWCYTGEYEVL